MATLCWAETSGLLSGLLHVCFHLARPFLFPLRCISWWLLLLTGAIWRTPAECKSTRTSSRRRSRSCMTSTQHAPKNASMPTHKHTPAKNETHIHTHTLTCQTHTQDKHTLHTTHTQTHTAWHKSKNKQKHTYAGVRNNTNTFKHTKKDTTRQKLTNRKTKRRNKHHHHPRVCSGSLAQSVCANAVPLG